MGLGNGRTIGLFATGVFAAVTLQRTLRAESPVVEKELLFRSRQFTVATIALLLYFTGFSVVPLGGTLIMQ